MPIDLSRVHGTVNHSKQSEGNKREGKMSSYTLHSSAFQTIGLRCATEQNERAEGLAISRLISILLNLLLQGCREITRTIESSRVVTHILDQ